MPHTAVRTQKSEEFEINKKLRVINKRISELENKSESHSDKLQYIEVLQQLHDKAMSELCAQLSTMDAWHKIKNKRISELEHKEMTNFLNVQDMAEMQYNHNSKIKELYEELQKKKQEQEMTHLQQTQIDQHNITEINAAANTQVENKESRSASALKRLEARLQSIDTKNPYTVAL